MIHSGAIIGAGIPQFQSITFKKVKAKYDFFRTDRFVNKTFYKSLRPINPFMQSGLFYLHSSDQSIYSIRGVWLIFIITMFIEIRRLIWMYTVCNCPIYRTPGLDVNVDYHDFHGTFSIYGNKIHLYYLSNFCQGESFCDFVCFSRTPIPLKSGLL